MEPVLDNRLFQFSETVFWDTDRNNLDLERNKKWIIARIIEHRNYNDLKLLVAIYGKPEIAETLLHCRPYFKPKMEHFRQLLIEVWGGNYKKNKDEK